MSIGFAFTRTLPALAGIVLFGSIAPGQIQPGGYTCSAEYGRTHNNSIDITARTATCQLPTSMVHWYDLSADPDLSGHCTMLRCVDFSLWSSSNWSSQEIYIRVYEDLLPASRDPDCPYQGFGSTSEPGPDAIGAVLLWEGATTFPHSTDGVVGGTPPRTDGDRSILVGDDLDNDGLPDGVRLPPNAAFFVELGHMGEAVTRFGGNLQGEVGDANSGPEVTWIRAPLCSGGGCVTGGVYGASDAYAKYSEWYPTVSHFGVVVQIHLDRDPIPSFPLLPFCPEDNSRDLEVGVIDLLAVLGSWGQSGICDGSERPPGDVAPGLNGDGEVDITDLLALLAAWGPCPNPKADCFFVAQTLNESATIGYGTFPFVIDGVLDGPPRPPTNDYSDILNGPTDCGWYDYGESGIPGGFRWGDAFGIDAALETVGGDSWFRFTAPCKGPTEILTTSDCGPGELTDTILEVYALTGNSVAYPESWLDLIACDDSSAPGGCGDHAMVEIDVPDPGEVYLIRVGGKFGEQGSASLIVRPKQFGTSDCNGNGMLDTWDICVGGSGDCNGNRIPDECEPDCNNNGLADVCDLYQNDCNDNGVPDECDLDCDANGVPDQCQSIHLIDSGPLAPFGAANPQSFFVTAPPEAIGDVTFSFFASADLGDALKSVDLVIDGYYVATVFADTGGACTDPGDREDFTYRRAFFNLIYTLDGDTDALIELVPTMDVDAAACPTGSFIEVTLKYEVEPTPTDNGATQDCNGNGLWDYCDVAPGGASMDINGNGVPDECES